MCVTMHSHTAEPLVMSKELFDGLSAEDQAMFQEAGLEASKWAYQHAKDTDAENREYLEGQMTRLSIPIVSSGRSSLPRPTLLTRLTTPRLPL